jgi:cytochrome c biogenesis protein CcmG/thiol:disulfide interchange protein DsbE
LLRVANEAEGIMTDSENHAENHEAPRAAKSGGRRALAFLPFVVFAAIALLFLSRLFFGGDHSQLPSALIGSKVPAFDLASVDGLADRPGLSDADLRRGHVTLLNFFASWCVPCRQEHPVLSAIAADPKLAADGVSLVGIAYEDDPAKITRFLAQEGDPYARIGADRKGLTGIDFGVYGVPETYVVKGDGTISYKFIGPMSEESFRNVLLPEIEKARR